MTEREAFLKTWEREFNTTIKVLKHFPLEKENFKPAEKTRTAKELAWVFVQEMKVLMEGVLTGRVEADKMPPVPATMAEALTTLQATYPQYAERVAKLTDTDFDSEMDFFVGPGQMGKVQKSAILWFMLYDMIHHRGQLSIYNRLVGAKVPAIYGPSADEPWM